MACGHFLERPKVSVCLSILGRKNDSDPINVMSGKSWMAEDYPNRWIRAMVFVSYQLYFPAEMYSKSLR